MPANFVWRAPKAVLRRLWFQQDTARKAQFGPYRGLIFEISPQMRSRMCVFYTAYEPHVTHRLRQWLRPGMIAFDVGAHIGIHALYAAKLTGPQGLVYAFEPFPENYQLLTRNIAHNKARNVLAINQAIAATAGTVGFTRGLTDGTHHLAAADEAPSLMLTSDTLDAFCERQQRWPELLLIDVEGAEAQVLCGGRRLLSRGKPRLILEHHDRCDELYQLLRQAGYQQIQTVDRHIFAH